MNIVAFNFESSNVRIVMGENGEPMFVAADVLSTLSLDRKALERIDDDEKGVNSHPWWRTGNDGGQRVGPFQSGPW
jgi:prophage antirepressor-like protein